ncbi:nucleotidyltransferase domain-containing protein [Candidatus Woesearchaeota archaeon]|nr:nucleotidyltransferase domain-containing protein [Candidatus Woesearchaeota archaeon]
MLLDICLGTRTAWKILFVLGEAPGKAVTRKEIQSLTRLGNKTLVKFLMLLEKCSIIRSEKIGKAYYYKMNMSNQFSLKVLELIKLEKTELNQPDFQALNMLRDFTYELTNVNLENLSKVILFGSYAKRTFSSSSDIDLAIILKERNPADELIITEVIGKLGKRYKKEIQPHYYTEKEFEELKKKNKLAKEITKDGIILI